MYYTRRPYHHVYVFLDAWISKSAGKWMYIGISIHDVSSHRHHACAWMWMCEDDDVRWMTDDSFGHFGMQLSLCFGRLWAKAKQHCRSHLHVFTSREHTSWMLKMIEIELYFIDRTYSTKCDAIWIFRLKCNKYLVVCGWWWHLNYFDIRIDYMAFWFGYSMQIYGNVNKNVHVGFVVTISLVQYWWTVLFCV